MLILHIGRHKCGSTSIQHFMACNAKTLRDFNVVYPSLGRQRHAHHGLAAALKRRRFDVFDEIVRAHKERAGQKTIISSEEMCLLRPDQIQELKNRIGAVETLVVMYIRDLVGWLPSKYAEYTKKGLNFDNFDAFFDRHNLKRGLKLASRAEQWAKVFGWSNVRIRSLDSRNLTGGTLIDDFLSTFELSLLQLGGPGAKGLERRNVSYGWKVLEVLRSQYVQLGSHRQFYEIRKDRPCINRDLTVHMRGAVLRIMSDLGLDVERTQYVSAQQWQKCNSIYTRELEKLNRKLVGPKLLLPSEREIKERPFLPGIERLPAEERHEIERRLQGVTTRWQQGKFDDASVSDGLDGGVGVSAPGSLRASKRHRRETDERLADPSSRGTFTRLLKQLR